MNVDPNIHQDSSLAFLFTNCTKKSRGMAALWI